MHVKKFLIRICTDLVNFFLSQCKKLFSPITTDQLVRAVHRGGNLEQWLSLGANASAKDYNGFTIFYNIIQDTIIRIAQASDLPKIKKKFKNIDVLIRYRTNLHLHNAGIDLLHAIPKFMQYVCNNDDTTAQLDVMFNLFSSWQLAIIKAGIDLNTMQENSTVLFKHLMISGNLTDRNMYRGFENAALQLIDAKADVNAVCDEIILTQEGQVNTHASTALHAACKQAMISVDLINALIRAGANVNAADDLRKPPFFYISFIEDRSPRMPQSDFFALASQFLSRGANLRAEAYSVRVISKGGVNYFKDIKYVPPAYSMAGLSSRILGFLWGETTFAKTLAKHVYVTFDATTASLRLCARQ